MIKEMLTNEGVSLHELSTKQPVLLVFLRHFGCVFCKEALDDVAELRNDIENQGIKLVFVHMSPIKTADIYFNEFNLKGVAHISNPEKSYYTSFGLMKGSVSQLYGLRTWIRGFGSKMSNYKLELAEQLGDSTQMPGMFLIKDGMTIESYFHKRASDRPDYTAFLAKAKTLS